MAAHGLSICPITPSSSATNRKTFDQVSSFNFSNSFLGTKLSVQPLAFRLIASRRRSSAVAAITLSLPTTKPEEIDSDKNPKWSARATKAFSLAQLEARKLKYPKVGTESILMGLLVEGTSLASKFLRENGITHFKVREETVKLLGRSDYSYVSPRNPLYTKPAQRALDWAVEEKKKSGEGGEVTATYLLLGIWAQKEFAGHKILAKLGFDDDKAKEIAKNMDKDTMFSIKSSAQQVKE